MGSDWCCRCEPTPVFDCRCAYAQAFGKNASEDQWWVDLGIGGWLGHDQNDNCYVGNTTSFCESLQGLFLLHDCVFHNDAMDDLFGIFGHQSPCSPACSWIKTTQLAEISECVRIFSRVSLEFYGYGSGESIFWGYQVRVEIMLAHICAMYACGIVEATYRSAAVARNVYPFCDALFDEFTQKVMLTKYQELFGPLELCDGALPNTIYAWRDT